MILRDKTCRFPNCGRPAGWCEIHHIKHWADGGKTSLQNLELQCDPHHHLLHEGKFTLKVVDGRRVYRRPDGSVIEDDRAPP
ncbi:MAG: HNH endonuclease [Actinomycetota bacterium]|nr:HNH endonuclease [Actinomycetota bacterium]